MDSCASTNDIESVEAVLKEMEEGDEVTQLFAYSTLVCIYCSFGLAMKVEAALIKLEELIDRGNLELLIFFLISLYAKTNNLVS